MQESTIDPRTLVLTLLEAAGVEMATAGTLALFQEFAGEHPDCCERTCTPGHFTLGPGCLSDGERALLLHHRKLDRCCSPRPCRWRRRPGCVACARRRKRPAAGARIEGGVFDLDRHAIRPRREPENFHYDVRSWCAPARTILTVSESRTRWPGAGREVDEDPYADESVRRMARKLLALG